MKIRSQDPNIWIDKHGVSFVIPELTDEHLMNILTLIYRANVRKMRESLLKEAARLKKIADHDDLLVDGMDYPMSPTHHLVWEKQDLAKATDLEILTYFIPQLPTLEFEARRRALVKPLSGMRGAPGLKAP